VFSIYPNAAQPGPEMLAFFAKSNAHVQERSLLLTARIRMHILASAKFGIDRSNLIGWIHSTRSSAVYIGLN